MNYQKLFNYMSEQHGVDLLESDMQEIVNIVNEMQQPNEAQSPLWHNGAVMPNLFFVVEEVEDGVWEKITIGLSTYDEAKAYKDRWDGKHPNAFIVSSFNEA